MALDMESYVLGTKKAGGGSPTDYTQLTNLPQINGRTLTGNKTSKELGIDINAEITIDIQQLNSSTLQEEVGKLITENKNKVIKVYTIDGSTFMSDGYIQVLDILSNYTPSATFTGNFGTDYTTVQIQGAWNNDRTEYTVSSLISATMNTKKALSVDNSSIFTPTGNYQPATKKYVDDNVQIIQYSTMPTASATNEGKIVQFIGTTDSTYTNGYFYQVVSDGQNPATYSWENINVQAGGSGGLEPIVISITSSPSASDVEKILYVYDNYDTNREKILLYGKSGNKTYPATSINKTSNQLKITFEYRDDMGQYSEYGNTSYGLKYYYMGISVDSVNRTISVYNNASGTTRTVHNTQWLGIYNTTAYTPTGNYHPSTKLYTDKTHYENMTGYDATKTQVLKNVNGTLQWVTEE